MKPEKPSWLKLIALLCIWQLSITASPLQSSSFLGFDRNDYPGDQQLAALHKTFAFTGYWLNSPPGANANTWAGKRTVVAKNGFGFLVLFNGKTYAQLKGNEAEELGAADGEAAIAAAKREGFPAKTIIFLDQEEGGRLLDAQKAYLFAWVDAVNSGGYRAGIYCSGIAATESSSGETVVTADDIRKNAGDRKIAYFVANDQCPPSPGCEFTKIPALKNSGTDFADVWQFAQSPRRTEFTQSCAQTYDANGNCYAPGAHAHVDVEVAVESDPSHGR